MKTIPGSQSQITDNIYTLKHARRLDVERSRFDCFVGKHKIGGKLVATDYVQGATSVTPTSVISIPCASDTAESMLG